LFPSKLSVSRVRFFLGAGAEDLVPVLFDVDFDDLLAVAPTLPFNASFYLAKACSLCIFSSSARHLAM